MKKCSILFVLSFVSYFIILFAISYVTARTWADICFIFFITSIFYQISYIIFLRKKDKVSICRSLSRFFLYAFISINAYIVVQYINIYINGYIQTSLINGVEVATYYGFDAWKNNVFGNILFLPILAIASFYEILYFKISLSLKKEKSI